MANNGKFPPTLGALKGWPLCRKLDLDAEYLRYVVGVRELRWLEPLSKLAEEDHETRKPRKFCAWNFQHEDYDRIQPNKRST